MHDPSLLSCVKLALAGLIVTRSAGDALYNTLFTTCCFCVAYSFISIEHNHNKTVTYMGTLMCVLLSCLPLPASVVQIWAVVVLCILRVLDSRTGITREEEAIPLHEPLYKPPSALDCF